MSNDKNMDQFVQKTLVLIKPDALERNLAGEIISRLERVGLKIVDCKMVQADAELAKAHYPVTDEWLIKVGNNTISDSEKYGFDPKEMMGSDDPKELGEMIHRFNQEYLLSGKVIALIFEGKHAVEIVRKIIGHTIPVFAQPGTIRGDLANESVVFANYQGRSVYNLVHASGTPEEAQREIKLWFREE